MKFFIRSLFSSINMIFLLTVIILFAVFKLLPILFIGIATYLILAYQTALNSKFQEKCIISEKVYHLRRLNYESRILFERIQKRVARRFPAKIFDKVSSMLGINNAPTFEERITKVEQAKQQIIHEFFANQYSNIKQKIAQKSLELAIVYYKLMFDYIARIKDISPSNLNSIHVRKENNRRKIISSRNPFLTEQLKSAVEADEKLIERLVQEKAIVEKMAVELNVIESTIALLKQQYYSQNLTDNLVIDEIENTVNEAVALENALHQHYLKKAKRKA